MGENALDDVKVDGTTSAAERNIISARCRTKRLPIEGINSLAPHRIETKEPGPESMPYY